MKILKVILILLVPALGIVSCAKSDRKPRSCSEHKTEDKTAAKTTASDDKLISDEQISDNQTTDIQTAARGMNSPLLTEDENTSLVGSGDDDRDGGDKKKKAK
ncbi:MAG TPA: hypothetical protein PL029_05750 [Bacteroidia bacterium]|nr:hypothetical protein [Bacteroidia bacterium]